MTTAGGEPTLLVWALRRAARRFAVRFHESLAAAGCDDLTPRGTWAVQLLHGRDRSAGELTAALQVSKQAVSTLVEELVGKGYLERRPDPGDRRRTLLHLSERGERAATVIEASASAVEGELLTDVGPEDLAQLRRILDALA